MKKDKAVPSIKKIILPTRPQIDTLIAVLLLKKLGGEQFSGIADADVLFGIPMIDEKSWSEYEKEGVLLVDVGGGPLDHHGLDMDITLSELIAQKLGIENKKTIKKLLTLARRDDVDGQGTFSDDPVDRSFGMSALLVALNRQYPKDPNKVFMLIYPLLEAHYIEQAKRIEELPKLFDDMLKKGTAQKFTTHHRGKKRRGVWFESDEPSMASHLRSFHGGNFDVVIQKRSTGHVNILTHTNRRPDLSATAAILRKSELIIRGKEVDSVTTEELAQTGRLDIVPEWYFDLGTNSVQNGGVNPNQIEPTLIPSNKIIELVKIGLEEKMWSPQSKNKNK